MIQAKHIMKPSPPVLSYNATIFEAIQKMQEAGCGFLAIRASANRYQGVITEGNLLRVYLRFQSQVQNEELILYRDLLEPMQLIHEDEVFPEVMRKLLTSIGHRIFVINSQSEVIGYVTAKHILPYISGGGQPVADDGENQKDVDGMKSELYYYESFFSKSPFMMHSVNREGVIQMANEMLHQVLGYEYGDLIGKTIFDLYPKSMHKLAEEGLKTILTKGFHKVVKSQMHGLDGQLIDVELVSSLLENQFQQPVGTITVSRPVDMSLLLKNNF